MRTFDNFRIMAISAALALAIPAFAQSGTGAKQPKAQSSGAAAGQQDQGGEKAAAPNGERGKKGARRGTAGGGLLDRLTSELNLTADQQTQIRTVIQTHFQQARQAQQDSEQGQQIAAIRDQMRQAREAGDQQRLEELRKQLRELTGSESDGRRAAVQQSMQELRGKIAPLLTPEQQEKFAAMDLAPGATAGALGPGAADPRRLRSAVQKLDLTSEQRAQVDQIFQNARDEMKSLPEGDRRARYQLGQKVMSDVRAVLTPEQQTQLQELLSKERTRTPRKPGKGTDDAAPGGESDPEMPEDPA